VKWLQFLLIMLTTPVCAQMIGEKVYRLGELAPSASSLEFTRSVTLLANLGFIEGRNLVVAERVGEPRVMQGLARELLFTKPDVIIAIGPDAIRAASEATSTVPIVSFGSGLVEKGVAASLVSRSALSDPPVCSQIASHYRYPHAVERTGSGRGSPRIARQST